MLVANPIAAERQLEGDLHQRALSSALEKARELGVKGKDVTPVLLAGLLPALSVQADDAVYRSDPAKIMGAEACAECHAPMVEAWKLTHHYDTFTSMHRRPEAKDIATKMGLRRIKEESLCLKCHYTSQTGDDGATKVISGISCESCHSAAKDWIKVHSAKDDPDRLAKAVKIGMLRPGDIYKVAANCFSCHTVPEEKLVNTGGHKAGSDFELVSWLSGEVRHNLQKSNGKVNAEIPAERRRLLYVLGRSLDLEYSVRGLASATMDGAYAQAMIARVNAAKAHLTEIEKATSLPEVQAILDAVVAGELKPANADSLTKIADTVAANAIKLSNSDGSKWAAVDPLIPGPDKYVGTPYAPAP